MSVIVTDLAPMTQEAFYAVVVGAASSLVAALPRLPDGTLDLTGVRLTYSTVDFVLETGIPTVELASVPDGALDAGVTL